MNEKITHDNWYINPIELPNADEYIFDLYNISLANTGFVHAWESNLFFEEASQLIVNAIKLFQLGYFDCAFYSLRQSIETSIGTIYLTENPDKKDDWEALREGFESGKMSAYLKKNETTFRDLVQKMPKFFENIRNTNKAINKYVHKQGAQTFYCVRKNLFLLKQKHVTEGQLLNDFENFLKVCIGAVAVYRLSIDALPVVLMDEEMLYRSGDFITAPYSEEFVDKYIGIDNLNDFKKTKIYKDFCASLSEHEKQNEAVFHLIHEHYFDRNHVDDYIAQLDLCTFIDRIAMCLFTISTKISQIFIEGIHWYFSDVKSNNQKRGITLGSSYFEGLFCNNNSNFNIAYHNVYISRCLINGDYTYMEHNEPLSKEEISCIAIVVEQLSEAAKQIDKNWESIIKEAKNDK